MVNPGEGEEYTRPFVYGVLNPMCSLSTTTTPHSQNLIITLNDKFTLSNYFLPFPHYLVGRMCCLCKASHKPRDGQGGEEGPRVIYSAADELRGEKMKRGNAGGEMSTALVKNSVPLSPLRLHAPALRPSATVFFAPR